MINGKVLQGRGWQQGRTIGLAKAAAAKMEAAGVERDAILSRLDEVLATPENFANDAEFGALAAEVSRHTQVEISEAEDALREEELPFQSWGDAGIEKGARDQMQWAMRLPIAVAGALMPDAHQGYGLPIGGVLATSGAVIPYAVGVDIACRMRLSIYDVSPHVLGQNPAKFEKALLNNTVFGVGGAWEKSRLAEHEVLDDPAWNEFGLLRHLKQKATVQLGTSGSGNHFAEWGEFTLRETEFGLAPGTYLALLSHSGSRGVGAKICNEYSRIAQSKHRALHPSVRYLAWLPLDDEAGQEYWIAMELAGRYASANHAIIHERVARGAGLKEVAVVENHHNFAWRETLANGEEAIVHRKGATPAGAGVFGVIPGSMADAGYVVRGRGVASSLNSASHGAGRRMSRRAANESITKSARDNYLKERGVKRIGGGLDEAPQAYKNIEEVVAAQSDLVEIVGKFAPRIVRMADEDSAF